MARKGLLVEKDLSVEAELTPDIEEYIENDDGSVEIPMEGAEFTPTGFLDNLAEIFDDHELNVISSELVELVELDKKSREKRDKQYEEGLRRTGLGDDAPGGAEFDGASKVVHPVLAEACVDFSSRAIKELFPAAGPVKPWVVGDTTPKKLEKANRKSRYMNWQLTTQIQEYRAELEQLLTQLPMGGSQYQKFWRDDRKKRVCNEFVPVDEIFLPYSATNFYTSPRVTHRQTITRMEFNRRVRRGLYRDVFLTDLGHAPEESLATQANNKIEGREEDGYNEDGLRAVLEIYCWLETESDELSGGEYAPYIVTIDEDTEKVLSIYRNWAEGDARFEKLDWLVEWKFIPWRGAYAIGLPHLIGGLSAALTGSLRALLDSAHINNAPTMLKLKSGRIVGQNTQVNVTQVCDIEGPAGVDDIRKLAMAMPFNPPSPVLAGLMDKLYGLAKGVIATAEDKMDQVGDRTPVGTAQSIIEQGSATYSAIHSRLHESQKKALSIIHRLNGEYIEEQMPEELGEIEVFQEDFKGTMDVVPVSDPTIFSETQRFAQNQAIMQMSQMDAQDPSIPWKKVNVRRRMLKQMRIENIDELLPAPEEPITADLLTENSKALKGTPLKAADEQNHLAHIQGHMAFIESPTQLINPLVPPQALMGLFAHVGEHMQMYVTQVTVQEAQRLGQEMFGADEDSILAAATQSAAMIVSQQTAELMDKVAKLQQQVQQRLPKPQLPPEVQASIQIAQMDIQRKTQLDQATMQAKQAEQQSKQQYEQMNLSMKANQAQFEQQMAQAQQQFDNQLEQIRLQSEMRAESQRQEVELMKNQMDNHQKQMTELIKNRDDNETKILIERMGAQLNSLSEKQESQPAQQLDLTPQLQELNRTLDQLGKQQTNDALAEVMNGLRATIQTLNKPKMIIRDAQGNAQGIQ